MLAKAADEGLLQQGALGAQAGAVLEIELPFFRSSRAAAEVWKALIASSWAADSWSVEECSFGADVLQRILASALAQVQRDALSIGGEVAATVDLAFGVSGAGSRGVSKARRLKVRKTCSA